jgi:hypothetical protein
VRTRFWSQETTLRAAEKLCFVSGHDFSRAVNDLKRCWALAPACPCPCPTCSAGCLARKIKRMLTRQKCSKQHPYGVSPGSIALVDHSPPRASRFSTESRPFADLGRFCAPNSRLFTPNDRSFWISSSTYSSLPFLFLGVYQPSPGKQRGLISLISLISHFCYIFSATLRANTRRTELARSAAASRATRFCIGKNPQPRT